MNKNLLGYILRVGLFIFLIPLVTASNFQPVIISPLTQNMSNVTVWVCASNSVCNDTYAGTFILGAPASSAVVYLENVKSMYSTPYYFSSYVDDNQSDWVYNATKSYLGRGNITLADLPISLPASGDTTHISTSAQIYTFVTGQGYLTAESDPKIGSLSLNGWCKSPDGSTVTCTSGVPSYDDTALWANASDQQDKIATINSKLGSTFAGFSTLTNSKLCYFSSGDGKIYCTQTLPTPYDDTALWTNATNQNVQILAIQGNVNTLTTNATTALTNAATAQTGVNTLTTNTSNIAVALQGNSSRIAAIPNEPNIHGENITAGTVALAMLPTMDMVHMAVGWLNKTYADTLYQGTGVPNQPSISWANITTGFPAACTAGQFVTTNGASNTCAAAVTSVTCGTGLTGGAITGAGTCAADPAILVNQTYLTGLAYLSAVPANFAIAGSMQAATVNATTSVNVNSATGSVLMNSATVGLFRNASAVWIQFA